METFDAGATPDLEGFERPEVKEVSERIAGELAEISQREERREDRIEDLEARLEEREETISELEERVERLRDLREMVSSTNGLGDITGGQAGAQEPQETVVKVDGTEFDVPETIQAEVVEIREERDHYQEELKRVRAERDEARAEVKAREDRIEQLESTVADQRERLDELEWLAAHREEIEEATRRLNEAIGLGDADAAAGQPEGAQSGTETTQGEVGTEDYEALQAERDRLQERVDELESRLDASDASATEDGALTYTDHPTIQAVINETAAEGELATEHYHKMFSILEMADEPQSAGDVASVISLSQSGTRKVLKALRESNLLDSEGSQPERFYLDEETLDLRIKAERNAESARSPPSE